MKVAAVVLAAGASTRLGEPKQLVRLGEERLLERAVRVARGAGCRPVVVVLGANAEAIQAECGLGEAWVVLNQEWREGMGSSVRVGVGAVAGECDAAIVMTCDQPAVTVEHLRRLMVPGDAGVVASSYAGRVGVPACFLRREFPRLLALTGDAGARGLLAMAESVALADGELDVDTAESLAEGRALFG
jgi:molybdenum cofactor cytidylyltransferase